MKQDKVLFISFIVATVVLLSLGVFLLTKNSNEQTKDITYNIDYSKGQKIGSDSAQVKLVEFADYQCPACSQFAPAVKELLASYSGQLQYIYRHYPLPQHKNAIKAANLAEAAAEQGQFPAIHEQLYQTQNKWSELSDPTNFFLQLAKDQKLDTDKIKEALSKEVYNAKIQTDFQEGNSLNISYTPTFFLNNKLVELTSPNKLKLAVEYAFQNN